jgi:hypothetical protein
MPKIRNNFKKERSLENNAMFNVRKKNNKY